MKLPLRTSANPSRVVPTRTDRPFLHTGLRRRTAGGMIPLLFPILLAVAGISASVAASEVPYRDPSLDTANRVEDLLRRMTLKEKIGEMSQLNITMINRTGEQRNLELDEDKARDLILNHHVGSFLNGEAEPQEDWVAFITALQRIAVEETRLGIPILYGIDHMHGASYLKDATIFPHSINIAATFDPAHAHAAGEVTAYESAHLGHRWNFAPVVDLGRNPRWPRQYETFGESPYLASRMGDAYVRGLQAPQAGNPHLVAATAKHFLGYSDPISGWDRSPAEVSDQSLYEFHVPAFKAVIDAGIRTIMVNSGEINGVPTHASKRILTGLLRDELGFEGVVVTDWEDIGKLHNFHYTAATYKEAVLQAIDAGIDMSMTPLNLDFNLALAELVEEGRISVERIDESVRRILTLKFDIGLFEHPYPDPSMFDHLATADNRAKALRAAQESIVLLRNDGVLPLSPATTGIMLLLGPTADSKRHLSGGWTISWQGGEEERHPARAMTLRDALETEFPHMSIVMPDDWTDEAEVASLAAGADIIVAAIGEDPYTEFVGNITDLALPEPQPQVLRSLQGLDKPVIAVYIGGRPRLVTGLDSHWKAFIWAGLPGNKGGQAIASVLSGRFAPTGRLPFSYPRHPSHFAPHNHKPSDVYFFNPEEANDIRQGEASIWQYPFGYGLGYTEFSYSDLKVDAEIPWTRNMIEPMTASVTVTNTGRSTGTETVLWFLQDRYGSVTRPVRELKHVEKVTLAPGESRTLQFPIRNMQDLAFPVPGNRYRLEAGLFTLKVGGLQADFELKGHGEGVLEFEIESVSESR